MAEDADFLSAYLSYTSNTEVPAFFNRWSAITGIGALLGRQYHLHHGHFTINPNIYCMLIGSAGTRKSTAIKLMKKMLLTVDYTTIAASKTTKEKFLLDLAGEELGGLLTSEQILNQNIFGANEGKDAECFIMADEFNTFFGNGNIEFISLLGELWDFEGAFENRIKNGTSVSIHNPTISILGGNTPTGFSLAFPTEVIGQGFFSRLILVYGEPNGRKIAFPKLPDESDTRVITTLLRNIKHAKQGIAKLSGTAEMLLEKIYAQSTFVDDARFDSYSNRRFQHLLKLCLITSASRYAESIGERDVIYANTILTYTESLMPKALGEFGRAKNADVAHKVLGIIERTTVPVTLKMLWREVSQDLENMTKLGEIISNLREADKIQWVDTHRGFLPKRRVRDETSNDMVDYSLLTNEERGVEQ